jgi:hypothetical protein
MAIEALQGAGDDERLAGQRPLPRRNARLGPLCDDPGIGQVQEQATGHLVGEEAPDAGGNGRPDAWHGLETLRGRLGQRGGHAPRPVGVRLALGWRPLAGDPVGQVDGGLEADVADADALRMRDSGRTFARWIRS